MFDSTSLLFKVYYYLNKYRFSSRARALLYELFQNIGFDDDDLELLDSAYGMEIVLNLTPQAKRTKTLSPISTTTTTSMEQVPNGSAPVTPRMSDAVPVIAITKSTAAVQSPQDESPVKQVPLDTNVVI